jgi:hypothetical protein
MKQIMLFVLCTLILAILSACGTVAATNDSQHVVDAASQIADFDVPTDFVPQFTASASGYTLAAYQGSSGPSHLFLIQSDNQADGSELEKMLKELAPGASNPNTRLTVIENRTATVRGQQVNVVISEGLNSDNVSYRQLTVGFPGKGGPAMLVFSNSLELWDQEAVDALLTSIQ